LLFGSHSGINIAIIDITTKSSMSVNPLFIRSGRPFSDNTDLSKSVFILHFWTLRNSKLAVVATSQAPESHFTAIWRAGQAQRPWGA